MSSDNNSYYETLMPFFGGITNFPAIKLYIHALDKTFNLFIKKLRTNIFNTDMF